MSISESPDVECTIDGRIAHIRFVRPGQGNAFRPQTCREMIDHARDLAKMADLGAIVVSGEGPIFCAGGDLAAFNEAEPLGDFVYDMAIDFHVFLDYFDRINAPTIAAVEGNVGGAGVSMVAAFDLGIVAENATFTLGYPAVGLTPHGSSRAVGLKRALDFALSNETIDAQKALDWGLATRLAPAGETLDHAMELARSVAGRDTVVLGETKRLIKDGTTRSLSEAMAEETDRVAAMAARPEARNYISEFAERQRERRATRS
jgi:2-(1,2-epoxy-1,2-dihydrophenyl)acetyl-CoA isomerase